ncbi:6235_t:CDS:2, partial [Funneliformis caledonium]
TNRSQHDNILSDIYDGQKTDNHLGLIINLDWFQPYNRATYSTGVLYAALYNLPCNIRFQPENIIILSILSGPNEVSLHKINHYLSPIITEFESL